MANKLPESIRKHLAKKEADLNRDDPEEMQDYLEYRKFIEDAGYDISGPGVVENTGSFLEDKVIPALGKADKVLGAEQAYITGPMLEKTLKGMTGKDTVTQEEKDARLLSSGFSKPEVVYPSAALQMERAGIPEGIRLSDIPSIPTPFGINIPVGKFFENPSKPSEDTWRPNVGGLADISSRGTIGAGIDYGGSILTGAARGLLRGSLKGAKALSALSAANKAARGESTILPKIAQAAAAAGEFAAAPVSKGLDVASDVAYKWGNSPLSMAGFKLGKDDVVDTLYRRGIRGGEQARYNQIRKAQKDVWDELGPLRNLAEKRGAKVSTLDELANFEDWLRTNKVGRGLSSDDADEIMQSLVSKELGKETAGLTETGERVSRLYKGMPGGAAVWDRLSQSKAAKGVEAEVSKKLSNQLRDAELRQAEQFLSPEDYGKYKKSLLDYGNLRSAENKAFKQAERAANKEGVSLFDIARVSAIPALAGAAGYSQGGTEGALIAAGVLGLGNRLTSGGRGSTMGGYLGKKITEAGGGALSGATLDALASSTLNRKLKEAYPTEKRKELKKGKNYPYGEEE